MSNVINFLLCIRIALWDQISSPFSHEVTPLVDHTVLFCGRGETRWPGHRALNYPLGVLFFRPFIAD